MTTNVPKVLGPKYSAAAVFIYKNDGTEDEAWQKVECLAKRDASQNDQLIESQEKAAAFAGKRTPLHPARNPMECYIRAECHSDRDSLLEGLRQWRPPRGSEALLCIYAHMGSRGINCKGGAFNSRISWNDLENALPTLSGLWLAGCKSDLSIEIWEPITCVMSFLLTTTESAKWIDLIPRFLLEIDMACIQSYETIASEIVRDMPGGARYYRRVNHDWALVSPDSDCGGNLDPSQ
jgi:hypothetical protein